MAYTILYLIVNTVWFNKKVKHRILTTVLETNVYDTSDNP